MKNNRFRIKIRLMHSMGSHPQGTSGLKYAALKYAALKKLIISQQFLILFKKNYS